MIRVLSSVKGFYYGLVLSLDPNVTGYTRGDR